MGTSAFKTRRAGTVRRSCAGARHLRGTTPRRRVREYRNVPSRLAQPVLQIPRHEKREGEKAHNLEWYRMESGLARVLAGTPENAARPTMRQRRVARGQPDVARICAAGTGGRHSRGGHHYSRVLGCRRKGLGRAAQGEVVCFTTSSVLRSPLIEDEPKPQAVAARAEVVAHHAWSGMEGGERSGAAVWLKPAEYTPPSF
ncbi:hypothetical protein FB451DRAFT_1268854 [Mycena latifolia]|nr:hypothetical protein FB451DRAFT_1268854 [Mycena latifolia]